MTRIGFICAVVLALAGCGGGGGSAGTCFGSPLVCNGVEEPTPPPGAIDTAVGLYEGVTSTGRVAYTLVLPDNAFWLLYGAGTTADVLAGVVQGNSTADSGQIVALDLVDISAESTFVLDGALDGAYLPLTSIAGQLVFGPAVATFNGLYDPPSAVQGTLAAVAGSYTGTSATLGDFDPANLEVSATGVVTGLTSGGCIFSGTLLPVTGMNVFEIALTFGGAACVLENQSVRGVAFLEGTRLYTASLTPARSNAFIFSGQP